jgi:hypothetical protein
MTWTKTGDEFSDECWTLSDAAYRLHHEGLTWSNRKQTEGQLAKDDMRRWARRPEAAEELVNVGWWEDHGQHFQIIHHIGYQRTRAQVAHQSIVNAQNGRKGGRPRKPKTDSLTDSLTETESDGDRTGQDRHVLEGVPKKSGDSYTPSPAELRRIEENVRAGYES